MDNVELVKALVEDGHSTVWLYRTETRAGDTLMVILDKEGYEIAHHRYSPGDMGWKMDYYSHWGTFRPLPKEATPIDLDDKKEAYMNLNLFDIEPKLNQPRPAGTF